MLSDIDYTWILAGQINSVLFVQQFKQTNTDIKQRYINLGVDLCP